MLSVEQVKPFLLHEDRPVRDLAVDYFHDSWSQDTDLVPIILQACRRYGGHENIHGLAACNRLVLVEASLDDILAMLADIETPDIAWHLLRAIVHVPIGVLLQRESAILDLPNLPEEIVVRINRRKDLSGWPEAKLWQELQDFARRSEDKRHVGEIDHGYAHDMVEAMGGHDEPKAAVICDLLRTVGEEQGWLEIFLVDLVGERRLHEAIPLLVDRLRIDTDYLRDRVMDALGKIGDPEAVRLIRAAFPNEPWHVKNYASGALGRIKHPATEDAILELLETEQDVSIRTTLCMELCDLFSERGVEIVRRQINAGYDRMIVCLEDHLLPVAHVLGIEPPEADAWRAEREERERRQAQRRAELEDLGRRHQAAKARGIDPLARLKENPEPSTPKLTPVENDQPRVGRNDPCPCGSGKKFKKCCARKPR